MYVTDIFLDNGETTGYRAFTCRQNNKREGHDLWQARVNIEVSHSTSRYKSEKKEKRMEKAESKELLL